VYGLREGHFGVNFGFGGRPKSWGMGAYGQLEAWVMKSQDAAVVADPTLHETTSLAILGGGRVDLA